VSKVMQLRALLSVRHSVMLLGSAGCGKTCVWTVLQRCLNLGLSRSTAVHEVVNPKCVSSDELYGHLTLARVSTVGGDSDSVRYHVLL
jgi:dynein heavy chain